MFGLSNLGKKNRRETSFLVQSCPLDEGFLSCLGKIANTWREILSSLSRRRAFILASRSHGL